MDGQFKLIKKEEWGRDKTKHIFQLVAINLIYVDIKQI